MRPSIVVRAPDKVATATPLTVAALKRHVISTLPGQFGALTRTPLWYPAETIGGFSSIVLAVGVAPSGTDAVIVLEKNAVFGIVAGFRTVRLAPGQHTVTILDVSLVLTSSDYVTAFVAQTGGARDLTVHWRVK